jgi:hypothetical protein
MVPESEDFSRTVADTPHQYQENLPYFEGLSSYRSHQLPTRTSLDNLLTAVNVASEIDATARTYRLGCLSSRRSSSSSRTQQAVYYQLAKCL